MTVITFPGQGAQKPGFLTPWLSLPGARETLDRCSAAAGLDLAVHGTESDAERLRDTAVAQPLMVAAGIITWDALITEGLDTERVAVAGHSVGEIAAAYAAGIFDADTAMRFVSRRATLMAEDATAIETGMSAVVGGDESVVVTRLDALGLAAANFNGAGQIVAAGEPASLDELRATPPEGARVVPLKVAGAFHSRFMQHAREALTRELAEFPVADPHLPIYTNRDGTQITSGEQFRSVLAEQIASPVRWDQCMSAFAADGHRSLVEVTPAGTLVGLAKRALPEFARIAVNTPDDLAPALTAAGAEGAAR